jgi:DNA-binding XRE family transcriptional regulator
MAEPTNSVPSNVYIFNPDRADDHTERSIVLEYDPGGATVLSTPAAPIADKVEPAEVATHWSKRVREILTPEFLDQLALVLQSRSTLPERVMLHLFEHLLKVYKHKVEVTIQTEGLDAIDTSLAHFKLIHDRKKGSRTLDLVFNDEKIQAYLRQSLREFFSHAGLWAEFAKAIGANWVVWAIENLEKTEAPVDATSSAEMQQIVIDYLTQPNDPIVQERIEFLGQIYCQDISTKIIEGFHLPTCGLKEIEKLLGLKQRPPSGAERSLDLNPIAVLPTAIPIASSIRAQLRPDLWQRSPDQLAVFQHRSKSNPGNYIEHYITNPGDIALLPWEAAEQIINKFGFDTVKLQLIFAARTMEEDEPWKSTFTVRATDIVHLLGWDRNHSTSLPEKRNAIASTAYALSCLLVKSVWIEGQGRKPVDASTPIGRMWDVLIDAHGQFDWVTGKIDKPDEVYITVSPGLWTKHFLNRAGSKAKEALHQFGYLAKDILKIDPYHNEMALRLAIQLTLDARVRVRNQNPYDYRVSSLLEEVLAKSEIEKALQDKHKARDLKNRWNNALRLLKTLGWQIEFDPVTYPAWLQPESQAVKPEDWRKIKVLDRLLQAKLTIKPPHPIPDLLTKIKEPKKPKAIEPTPHYAELTGEQIQQGREAIGWSRKELGGFLNLSADYIGKIERGDRMITPELETSLRKLLHLR